jgi:hypothetical protein
MKIITRENNANVVELTNEELTSLEKEVKLQEFIKARMPEIKKYETQVKEYIEEHTSTHYADYYEGYKYLGYSDTYRYYMDLVEWNDLSTQPETSNNLTSLQFFQYEYWGALKSYMEANNSTVTLRRPKARNWDDISIGASDIFLSFAVHTNNQTLHIWLVFRGPYAKDRLRQLQRVAYDESLVRVNKNIVYDFMEGRKRCAVTLTINADFRDRQDWNNQFEWFKENLEKFDTFFRPLINSL